MPRVSQEHRTARREQILDAATRCFLRDGFHATSMQDLFAEAQLSSGAVYGYFRSKDDVIVAIAEKNMREVVELIHAMALDPHPDGLGAALGDVLDVLRRKHRKDRVGAMAVLVWSEALRNPTLAARFDALLETMRTDLIRVVRARQAAGAAPSDVDPEALGRLVMSVVPGYILQLALFGERAVRGVPDAARAMWSA